MWINYLGKLESIISSANIFKPKQTKMEQIPIQIIYEVVGTFGTAKRIQERLGIQTLSLFVKI